MTSDAIKLFTLRWLYIISGISITDYSYSWFDEIQNCAPAVRFVFAPAIVVARHSL